MPVCTIRLVVKTGSSAAPPGFTILAIFVFFF